MASAPSQEMSVGSGEAEGLWCPLGASPAPLHPMLPHLPCAYPAVPCYSLLQPPPLGLFTQPVPVPCELPGGPPLLWPAPVLCSPLLRPGTPEDPSRGKAAASRESTAALKAWLGQHPKNPYPSKGEKVLLAIVSRMSLTQVSTWFANARRRLKKENRAAWAPRTTPKAEDAAEEEEEEEEEEEGSEGEAAGRGGEGARAAPPSSTPPLRTPKLRPRVSPAEPAAPWLRARRWQGLAPSSPPARRAQGPEEGPAKPKIWSVAELATSS